MSVDANNFKPQRLNLDGKVMTYKTYVSAVKKAVDSSKLPAAVKSYCNALVDHANGNLTDIQMKSAGEIFSKDKDSSKAKGGIQKYFGEVVGPIWVARNNIFGDMPKTDIVSVFHPSAENEPLMDYELQIQESSKTKKGGSNRKKTSCKRVSTTAAKISKVNSLLRNKVSAKSGKTTNTVKSKDILDLIEIRPDVKKFWKDSIQYTTLEILRDNNTAAGPLDAAMYLTEENILKNYFKGEAANKLIRGAKTGVVKTFLGKPVSEVLSTTEVQQLKQVVSQDNTLSKKFLDNLGKVKTVSSDKDILIIGYIAVAAERRVEKASKNPREIEFHEIFGDAVAGMVNYVTFEVDSKFYPKWKGSGRKELEETKGYFRSKNSMSTRLAKRGMADALGFQPQFG